MAALRCQELVELLTDYLEGTLGWRDRRRVARHLRACDLLGSVPVDTLSLEAQATLLDAFRDLER
jgi:hypothetical protein